MVEAGISGNIMTGLTAGEGEMTLSCTRSSMMLVKDNSYGAEAVAGVGVVGSGEVND